MSYQHIIERLQKGESVELNPQGQSMTPKIKSGERIVLSPIETDLAVGDIVLAKVHGKYYIHLVSAIVGDRIQISNNHKYINGTTSRDKIYGVVTEIGPPKIT